MPSKNPHRRRRSAAALTATIALLIASAFPVLASADPDVPREPDPRPDPRQGLVA